MSEIEKITDDYFEFFDAEPPIIEKVHVRSKDCPEGRTCWHARHPGVCSSGPGSRPYAGNLMLGPLPIGAGHVVEEHEDGHITVRPNPPSDPGNSNSILCPLCGWHGYVDHGRWYTV